MLVSFLLVAFVGCQTLREVRQLRNVAFTLERVGDAHLAGVDLRKVRSYEDLTAREVIRLGTAVAEGSLPFDFVVHVRAENPEANGVQARLLEMDWTLFLDEEETVSGTFGQTVTLPPGEPTDVEIPIELDLYRFFERNARDLFELALAVSGRGGTPKRIELRARPTIDTALGPLRYPRPVVIASEEVGS